MATVTGLTAARMQEIIDATIVDADIIGGHLILTKDDGSTYDAGAVGPAGKGTAFPAGATDGDLFVRTDQPLDPLYKYTDGVWTLFTGGGVGKGTAFPTIPAPTDGDMYVRTDQTGDPLYKYTDGVWELQPRMGSLTVPEVTVRRNSIQTNGVSNDYAVSYDTVLKDTNGMWSGANPTRLTVKTPGRYRITATLGYSNYAPDWQALRLNGIPSSPGYLTIQPVRQASGYQQAITWEADFAAGDYIEHVVHNTGGGDIGLAAGSGYGQATMSMTWMGGPGQTVDERGVPAAQVSRATNQSIPGSANTAINLDTLVYDTDGMYAAASTTRLTAKTPGLYKFIAEISWASDTRSVRAAYLRKNGSTIFSQAQVPPASGGATVQQISGDVSLAAGDYVEVVVWQNVGGGTGEALNITGARLSAALEGSGKTVTPFARVYTTVAQSIPGDGSTTVISFDGEEADNDGIHDQVSNKTRLTCRTAGIYMIMGKILMGTGAGTARWLWITKNGSGNPIENIINHPTASRAEVVSIVELAVGDYVEMAVAQDSGAPIVTSTGAAGTHFAMVKVGAPLAGQTGIGPAQADVYTVATLPAANTVPNGRIVGVSDGAAGQQARMAMNGAWINLG